MSTPKRPARSLVSLNLPKQVPALIAMAKGIVQAMTGNANFPSPEPALSAVNTAIADLETAETAAQARTRGAATTRNDKRAALATLLEQLKGHVQKIADADLEHGAAIIQSAGMGVKKHPVRAPRVFDAKPGTTSGSVKLMAVSAARRAGYEWQYSTDGGKTWLTAPVTLQAKTVISGLVPGSTAMFRYRPVTKTGEADWSQPVSLIVK